MDMNPTEALVEHAIKAGNAPEDIYVISIGTGEMHQNLGIQNDN